jgi:hypothetical protein
MSDPVIEYNADLNEILYRDSISQIDVDIQGQYIIVKVPSFVTTIFSDDSGTPGPPGADGADGLSAYEVAVANGFVGTEPQWLASLEGTDGQDGSAVEYPATLLVRSSGIVVEVDYYADVAATDLVLKATINRALGAVSSVEYRDDANVLVKTKTIQRDINGVVTGVLIT